VSYFTLRTKSSSVEHATAPEVAAEVAADPKQVEHIRGPGFHIGLLVSGSKHQPHLLAMAKGQFAHEHLGHSH
jgi:hypothetical protein